MPETASETAMMFMDDPDIVRKDKEAFVTNLGWLLSQTREGVAGCRLAPDNPDLVIVKFNHGEEIVVNVAMDSYMALLRDVAKNI